MTLGFLLFTTGATLIYTSLNNMTVADLLKNRPSSLSSTDIFGGSSGGSGASGKSAGTNGPTPAGIGQFDGKPVCNWIIPWLQKARKAGWTGSVNSGYRSPAEQAQACQQVCGNPNGCGNDCAAPGSSNHQGTSFPKCAVDVTEAQQLISIFKKIGAPLVFDPSDACQCHFSHTGN